MPNQNKTNFQPQNQTFNAQTKNAVLINLLFENIWVFLSQ